MAIKYKNAKKDLTSTDATVVLTATSATTCIIKSIMVSNDSTTVDRLHVVASYMEIS